MRSFDKDKQLMMLIAKGDQQAFRELVSGHINRIVKIAERVLGNRQDAEDITQEVCQKIWNEAPRWKPQAKFTTWLYRVIINLCIDHKRKVAPFKQMQLDDFADEALGADEVIINNQTALNIKDAMQKLPYRQRASVILSFYEQVSNKEAAEVMGMDVNAFQQLLFRAKANLKNIMIDDFKEEDNARRQKIK